MRKIVGSSTEPIIQITPDARYWIFARMEIFMNPRYS